MLQKQTALSTTNTEKQEEPARFAIMTASRDAQHGIYGIAEGTTIVKT